jgi:hypothetical protein
VLEGIGLVHLSLVNHKLVVLVELYHIRVARGRKEFDPLLLLGFNQVPDTRTGGLAVGAQELLLFRGPEDSGRFQEPLGDMSAWVAAHEVLDGGEHGERSERFPVDTKPRLLLIPLSLRPMPPLPISKKHLLWLIVAAILIITGVVLLACGLATEQYPLVHVGLIVFFVGAVVGVVSAFFVWTSGVRK